MRTEAIVRNTIGEQVFSELRRRIATGQVRPGARLRPDEIAAELSVSQTPVKEALLRLDAEGLVETTPRRGSMVRRLSRRNTVELFQVRAMIETWALQSGFAAGRVTPQFLRDIGTTVEDLSATVVDGTFVDYEAAMQADRRMHDLIVGLSGNALMIDWYRRVISQTEFIRLYTALPERAIETEAEHKAIHAALQAGKLDGVLAAIRAHFDSACRSLLPGMDDEFA